MVTIYNILKRYLRELKRGLVVEKLFFQWEFECFKLYALLYELQLQCNSYAEKYYWKVWGKNCSRCFVISETSSWTELTLPQLSVPRAGHSIVVMETPCRLRRSEDGDEEVRSGSIRRSLLVFGGGDNEGRFYSDVTSVPVEGLAL